MPCNVAVTGRPGVGKSTVVERVVDRARDAGREVGGLVAPELRDGGARVGFELVDVATGDRCVLAHVDRDDGPTVGKYTVDVDAADALARDALRRARARDLVVVDEIAPMEVHAPSLVEGVRVVLDAEVPVLAVVHARSTKGLIGDVKARDDVDVVEVTEANRDELPGRLVGRLTGE